MSMQQIRASLQLHDSVQQYIRWALENVYPDERSSISRQSGGVDLDLKRIQLEIHFLFPNLTDDERRVLCDLRLAQLCVELGVNSLIWNGSEPERRELDSVVARMEGRFLKAKADVKAKRLTEKLSNLQKEIVENYCNVSFDAYYEEPKSVQSSGRA